MLPEPHGIRLASGLVQQITLVQNDEISLHKLGVVQVFLIAALSAAQKLDGFGLHQYCERRQLELAGVFLREAVVHMLQRPDAEAGDVRHYQLAALVVITVEAVGKLFVYVADAVVRDLGGAAAAQAGEAVIRETHPVAEVVGDHGGLAVVRRVILRQGHHGCGLAGAEKAAEHRKFFHVGLLLVV